MKGEGTEKQAVTPARRRGRGTAAKAAATLSAGCAPSPLPDLAAPAGDTSDNGSWFPPAAVPQFPHPGTLSPPACPYLPAASSTGGALSAAPPAPQCPLLGTRAGRGAQPQSPCPAGTVTIPGHPRHPQGPLKLGDPPGSGSPCASVSPPGAAGLSRCPLAPLALSPSLGHPPSPQTPMGTPTIHGGTLQTPSPRVPQFPLPVARRGAQPLSPCAPGTVTSRLALSPFPPGIVPIPAWHCPRSRLALSRPRAALQAGERSPPAPSQVWAERAALGGQRPGRGGQQPQGVTSCPLSPVTPPGVFSPPHFSLLPVQVVSVAALNCTKTSRFLQNKRLRLPPPRG